MDTNQIFPELINILQEATLVIDQEGRVIVWNRAMEELTDVKAANMLGKGDYEYAIPFYGIRRPMLVDLVQKPDVVSERNYFQLERSETRLTAVSTTSNLRRGESRLFSRACILLDPGGQIIGSVETIRDITESKKIEDEYQKLVHEVQNEKQFLEALIQNSPAAIVVIDLNDLVTTWNPKAEELFGYSKKESIGRKIDDLIVSPALRSEAEKYSSQTAEGIHVRAITRRSRKDGTLVDVELLGVPVVVDGNITGGIAIYHDITDLQQARQAAEAATRVKGEFLANMSHEIRTPMNGVIGMTSLLLDTILSDEQREYVEIIRKSGDSLLTIINDILDFSKIEAGKLELEMHPIDLYECVESAAELVAFQTSEQGLELLTNIELDVPRTVMGDVTRLRQILANLLSNATKFTQTGEVEIRVSMEDGGVSVGEECNLHFFVRDTGIGIPPENADRLFQVFSQMDASTTRKYGGTGLGLAICKRLTELMHGRIWAESPGLGKGSIFHVILPFIVTEQVRKTNQHAPHIVLREKTMLVVDDNATNRLIITRMAHSWGMKSTECASGFEALQKIDNGLKVDIAVLDIQMPVMDGVTLATELRKRTSENDLPFIIISSLGQKTAFPSGVNAAAYLYKPLKPSQLYDALVTAFDEKLEQQEPASFEASFDSHMGQRHPLRILLAEDHIINQKVMNLMLERLGYRTDIVSNGLEVIQSFKHRDYDVVLMDIQMPELNGIEATQHLRVELDPDRQPRIIALTANALGGEREVYLSAGMDDYLSKPVNITAMCAALEKCMPLGMSPKIIDQDSTVQQMNLPESMDPTHLTGSIDIPTLKEYFPYEGDDIQLVIDLAQEFISDTDERLVQLNRFIQQGDAKSVEKIAHAIKGASMTFGAKIFSELCDSIEKSSKICIADIATNEVYRAQTEFNRVRQELPLILKRMLP